MNVTPLGDAALLLTVAAAPGLVASAAVFAMDAALRAAALPGVVAIVPAYTTLLVHFAPLTTDADALIAAIRALVPLPTPPPQRRWHVPIVYDGVDLAAVAAQLGLTPARVVALHAGAAYAVACLGFAPGFAYLTGLPPELHVPRRATPRPQIPAGSVIVGGQQTAIMPTTLPSGWHVLGRARLTLFAATRAAPSLLLPGDQLRFLPITAAELADSVPRCEVLP